MNTFSNKSGYGIYDEDFTAPALYLFSVFFCYGSGYINTASLQYEPNGERTWSDLARNYLLTKLTCDQKNPSSNTTIIFSF